MNMQEGQNQNTHAHEAEDQQSHEHIDTTVLNDPNKEHRTSILSAAGLSTTPSEVLLDELKSKFIISEARDEVLAVVPATMVQSDLGDNIIDLYRQNISAMIWATVSMDVYQQLAHKTAIYPDGIQATLDTFYSGYETHPAELVRLLSVNYATLGLAGEAGEVANKVKKIIRDNNGVISTEIKHKAAKELAGVLWYLQECCSTLGISMSDLAAISLHTLYSRLERNTLKGSGDDR